MALIKDNIGKLSSVLGVFSLLSLFVFISLFIEVSSYQRDVVIYFDLNVGDVWPLDVSQERLSEGIVEVDLQYLGSASGFLGNVHSVRCVWVGRRSLFNDLFPFGWRERYEELGDRL